VVSELTHELLSAFLEQDPDEEEKDVRGLETFGNTLVVPFFRDYSEDDSDKKVLFFQLSVQL
jgi:hypothetical protein